MPSSREKIDLMVRISPFNQRVHGLIFFHGQNEWEKKHTGNFFKLDAPRERGLSSKKRRQNGSLTMFPRESTFLRRSELTC
jgi:hypothetical protein